MKNKVTLFLSLVLSVFFLFVSCDFNSSSSSLSSSGLTGTISSTIDGWIRDSEAVKTVVPTDGTKPEAYDADDFIMGDDYTSVEINLSEIAMTETEVTTKYDNYSITTSDSLITIESDNKSSLNFILSGTSSVGLKIKSKENFALTLSDATITSKAGSGKQALNCTKSSTCFLILSGTNTLTGDTEMKEEDDGTTDGVNVIKCDGSLVISGEGSLIVNAETKHGIVSDDTVVVNSGTINVTLNSSSSDGTGIKADNGFVQNGGEITITGENKTKGSENRGIKVEGCESEYGAGKGYVLINGGKLTITTSGKALAASFDITQDGDTESTTYDPLADVFINNGLITITTTATPRDDVTDSSGNVTEEGVSPEGIEGKRSVTINGGKIVINTTDDGINTSNSDSYISINGGLIYVKSSSNDAVDSNGTIKITGGILIALGSGAPEGGIDCDYNSSFTYSGGTVIALGGSNNTPGSSTTTGYYLYAGGSGMMRGFQPGPGGGKGQGDPQGGDGGSSLSSGDTITLLDSSGSVILVFTVPSSSDTSSLLIASSSLKKGATYSLSSSSKVDSADYTFENVFYMGDVEVSIDESESVTISSLGTSISL